MKNTIKFALAFAALFIMAVPMFGQKTIKLGHIDSGELLKIMPGRDSAQTALQKNVSDLEGILKTMQTELEQRYNEFIANQSQMSDLIKRTKEKEIQDMSMRIQEFQENAQKDLAEKERQLFEPIINKAKDAISEVAKEHKYTYVFDAAGNGLLYHEDSDDIMPMVKKKLNLK